ncbi:MAG: 50S ribosomal protein L25/general stress protein Ctc [Holosporaceae bacterium]|jgi:large subunit ribosomal protein L25|nr:50S ribosomal protein L25/general stress protein Ctc [Holosporaceae bacterium]
MSTIVLEAKNREKCGTGAARSCRKDGQVPCIIYGDAKKPESVSVSSDSLNRYVHKPNFFSTVFEIKGVGGKGQKFVAKDVQFHPVTNLPLHVDFMRVGKGSRVSVRVPLIFVNELASPGLKSGGVLNVLVHEIDVVCDPEDIPENIEIDLTGFEFHHTVHAHDVKLRDGVTLPIGCKNFTIATVVAPTVMKKEETEEEKATATADKTGGATTAA